MEKLEMILVDQHGRKIKKLRLSLTDKCNLRCYYCMPVDAKFMDSSQYLSINEILNILQELHSFGVTELRITGGEPLVRKDIELLLEKLPSIKFEKIGLTTNAILLDRFFNSLIKAKVFHLNISLDSLCAKNFNRITHGDFFDRVLKNIIEAKKRNFHIKLNTVVMKGINDHEIDDFIAFGKEHQIEIRFLELMKIGHANGEQKDLFISANEILENIKQKHQLKIIQQAHDSTSFNFLVDDQVNIGFIASESKAFCGSCSRWRLASDGILRACLFKEDGIDLRKLNEEQRIESYKKLLGMKPIQRPLEVNHLMNSIGG